jgi:hypothetical protein
VEGFPFDGHQVFVAVPEVIATHEGLPEVVAQAPGVEAEYLYEAQRAAAELNLEVDPVLREICGSDPHPILPARLELAEVFVASVVLASWSTRFCLPCLLLSTTIETKLQPRSAERKVGYQD